MEINKNNVENEMSFRGRDFDCVITIFEWLFCDVFDVGRDKRGWFSEYIFGTIWYNKAQTGDDMQYHRRRIRDADNALSLEPEAAKIINIITYISEALHGSNEKYDVVGKIKNGHVMIRVTIDTTGMIKDDIYSNLFIYDGEIVIKFKKDDVK